MQEAETACISYLAQREHSRDELLRKLKAAGVADAIAMEAVAAVAGAGMQSDLRYAEVYVRSRHARGYGPCRIRQELAAKGIAAAGIEQALGAYDWNAALAAAHAKRFGRSAAGSAKDYAARSRFLAYRGFAPSAVAALLRRLGGGHDLPCYDD